jgi:mono/diheme cytochrome c family protein
MSLRVPAIVAALVGVGALVLADAPTVAELKMCGEGRALLVQNCSRCHGLAPGVDAGDPIAPDLTQIAVRDGGFNRLHVLNHIVQGDARRFAPAEEQMPEWGRFLNPLKVKKIVRYLEFAQRQPEPSR